KRSCVAISERRLLEAKRPLASSAASSRSQWATNRLADSRGSTPAVSCTIAATRAASASARSNCLAIVGLPLPGLRPPRRLGILILLFLRHGQANLVLDLVATITQVAFSRAGLFRQLRIGADDCVMN